MARAKRHDSISQYHLDLIDRKISLLEIELGAAQLSLKPFSPHYDAISSLKQDLRKALNLLNDRPADYEEPHAAPMSRG